MLIIGMMSGTSLDGIDAVLARFWEKENRWELLSHVELGIPDALRQILYQLNFPEKVGNELHVATVAEQQITRCYADAYHALMAQSDVQSRDIEGIAAHGQTIRHAPNDKIPYTLQLLDGALLSHLTGQTVINDFRRKDIAAGGQGAPLAPLFHRELFSLSPPFSVVNIGGLSNISVLTEQGSIGFDCGPGNCLLDEWIREYRDLPFDENANWAQQGRELSHLLERCLTDNYFSKPAPKSTGRDYFNRAWLNQHLQGGESPVDVMRTLVKLTAVAIADCLKGSPAKTLTVVGGGAKNPLLVRDLSVLLPETTVQTSTLLGLDTQHVEAMGFAVLGRYALLRQPLDSRLVTGANVPVVMGAIHFA